MYARLSKRLLVLGHEIEVWLVDGLLEETDHYGYYKDKKIVLDAELGEDEFWTLLHEGVHMLQDLYSLEDYSETAVRILEEGLKALLRDYLETWVFVEEWVGIGSCILWRTGSVST